LPIFHNQIGSTDFSGVFTHEYGGELRAFETDVAAEP